MPKRTLLVIAAAVVVLSVAGTVAAQSALRFSDVPADHPDFAAINWAAEVGVTAGYGDGTFRPEQPLSLRHATVFLTRYYEEVLGADVSEDFTRSDMMRVLYEMAGSPGVDATTKSTDAPASDTEGLSGWTGDVWWGTSSFPGVGQNLATVCVDGDATEVVEFPAGSYWIFTWSSVDPDSSGGDSYDVTIEITGPNGASKRSTNYGYDWTGGADSTFLSVGTHANAHIDPGETSWSYSSDGTWAIIAISYEGLWFPTRKQHQQWAASLDCNRG